jgi:hypothetical protein
MPQVLAHLPAEINFIFSQIAGLDYSCVPLCLKKKISQTDDTASV